MTKQPTSDTELAPNRPLLLTLPRLAAHLRIDRATVYQASRASGPPPRAAAAIPTPACRARGSTYQCESDHGRREAIMRRTDRELSSFRTSALGWGGRGRES